MNVGRGVVLSALCLPLLWMLAAGFGRDPHAVPSMWEHKEAPDFVLSALDGRSVRLRELRGRPVLLNFWATWCYPCQSEHPVLQALARRLDPNTELSVLGIVYQDEPEAVRQYLREHPSPYPHLLDANSQVAIDYGVAGVPETFLIDANGIVAYKHAGVLTPQIIAERLVPLLPPRPTAAPHKGEPKR